MIKSKRTYGFRIGVLILALNIFSCQIDPCGSAPADLIENLEDLVKEVKKKDYLPRDDRWQTYDDRFRIFFEDCFDRWSPDMTPDQKRKFAGLTTRYLANRFGRSWFKSIFGQNNKDTEGIPESLDQLGDEFQKFLEENKEAGKDIWEDLLQDINEWFESETTD